MLGYNLSILKRFMTRMDPKVFAYNALYELYSGALTSKNDGLLMPNTIFVETGSHCRRRCQDCYVPLEDRKQDIQLTDENLADIAATAKHLRLNYLTIMGGDPFDPTVAERNLSLFERHRSLRFTTCTSGYGVQEALERLHKAYNAHLVFSIDGFKETNDAIRGRGSFALATDALEAYSAGGRQFAGIFTTLRSNNIDEATSPDFLHALVDKGAYYVAFTPYFVEQDEHALTPEAYVRGIQRLMDAEKHLPAVLFSNHYGQIKKDRIRLERRPHTTMVDYLGNVYTARRGRVFGNINDQPLLAILRSPGFQQLFQAKHLAFDAEAVGETDLRYPHLFKEATRQLAQEGVEIL